MQIGYVLKVFPRLSQTFVVNELRAHERAGRKLVIFSLKRPVPEDADIVQPPLNAEVIYMEHGQDDWPDELANHVERLGISHLHAHFGNIATHTARLAAKAAGITYSFTAHALDIFAQKVVHEELAQKVHEASFVVTISKFNLRHLTRTFGRRPALVYNGMPLETFQYSRGGKEKSTILAIGRLIEKKGFNYLVDACAELVKRGVDFRCEIVGDGELYDELHDQIQVLNLAEYVVLKGPRAPAEVREHLTRATVMAAPCVVAKNGDRDGLPTVLLEAMALGTPCVSTDVTGIPEVVVDGETGLQVPQHDAPALADALQRILEDPSFANRVAEKARQLIEDNFDSDKTAARLWDLWQNQPRRILFRIHNRKGMGHLMRSMNIARELLAMDDRHDILFYVRSAPPFDLAKLGIRYVMSGDPDEMSLDEPAVRDFAPQLVVDDTILPEDGPAQRVFVMRRCVESRQQSIFATPALKTVNRVIVPHAEEEFGYDLAAWLREKTVFVGPIVRRPEAVVVEQLRRKYGLAPDDFVLVSTPGGGGFDKDAALFFDAVREAHKQVVARLPNLRHIVIRGPVSSAEVEPVDDHMQVVGTEPELVSLFSIASLIISAGGYNSVQEIRLTKRPAIFLPGQRKYDDQEERVQKFEAEGLARVLTETEVAPLAAAIAGILCDGEAIASMHRHYAGDRFEPGNREAAREILLCLDQLDLARS